MTRKVGMKSSLTVTVRRVFANPDHLRPRLRRTLNRLLKSDRVNADKKIAIRACLASDGYMVLLQKDVDGLATFHQPGGLFNDDGAPSDRPILDWLWAHREEILAFILKIVGLFMAKDAKLARRFA